ncbi:MAG: stage III sporulation protein AG [Intestinimonas sp.]|jgi:stage III sporulation protein AG|nr:stage III sporulation protein AG [Intestinimonas sp.]
MTAEKKERSDWIGRLRMLLKKYRYAGVILLVGLVLLAIPSGKSAAAGAQSAAKAEEAFNLEEMEQKLSDALSKVDGAGKVQVMLTLKNGGKKILATDVSTSNENGNCQEERKTVVVSQGSSQQAPVELQQYYPQFQGALVICPGGEDAAVRLKLAEAVSALTGLGTDKISICKGT